MIRDAALEDVDQMNIVKINQEYREEMEALEKAMIAVGEQVELKVDHLFAHGTYTRIMYLPKGTVLTGKIHRHSCINIIPKGKMIVITDTGRHEVEAPHSFVSGDGVKKAGYAVEDTIWINVHPWEGEEDLELIEQELIIPSYEALEQEQANLLREQ